MKEVDDRFGDRHFKLRSHPEQIQVRADRRIGSR
jgi:hypothetical protein